jgi:hypothetical protein
MGQPVVHFEVIGKNPERLRSYYGELWRGVVSVGRPALECSGGACSPRTSQGSVLPHPLGLALGFGPGWGWSWGGPLDAELR